MGQHFEKNWFKKATQQIRGQLFTGSLLLSRKSGQHGPKLGSKIDQKSIKIDTKIDQKIVASWDRFLKGFWWILEGKMEPSWHQNRLKIDANCEKRFFEKSCSRCSGGSIFEILGVEVGSKNQSKIDQKMKSRWEGILASIFLGF